MTEDEQIERLMDILEAEFPEAQSVAAEAFDCGFGWGVAINLGNHRRSAVGMRSPDQIDEAVKTLRVWVDKQMGVA